MTNTQKILITVFLLPCFVHMLVSLLHFKHIEAHHNSSSIIGHDLYADFATAKNSLALGHHIDLVTPDTIAINKITVLPGGLWMPVEVDIASFASKCEKDTPCKAYVENGTLWIRPEGGECQGICIGMGEEE